MIKIKLFAFLKEMAGSEEISLEATSCEEALGRLKNQFPELLSALPSCLIAVNETYAAPSTVLREGDELAILPPVSGG